MIAGMRTTSQQPSVPAPLQSLSRGRIVRCMVSGYRSSDAAGVGSRYVS